MFRRFLYLMHVVMNTFTFTTRHRPQVQLTYIAPPHTHDYAYRHIQRLIAAKRLLEHGEESSLRFQQLVVAYNLFRDGKSDFLSEKFPQSNVTYKEIIFILDKIRSGNYVIGADDFFRPYSIINHDSISAGESNSILTYNFPPGISPSLCFRNASYIPPAALNKNQIDQIRRAVKSGDCVQPK